MELPIRLSPSLPAVRRLLRRFSSAPSPWSGGLPSPRRAGEGVAYRMSMLRPPGTVKSWKLHKNSCSFIGTVVRPVQRFSGGVYTFLDVNRPSGDSNPSSFRILLAMWDMLAEISLQYLKPNDFIYICGPLGTYGKINESGKREIFYKVYVKELNYVKCSDRTQSSEKPENSRADKIAVLTSGTFDQQLAPPSSEFLSLLPMIIQDIFDQSLPLILGAWDHEKEHRNHLHLWQVFFANPFEWWDNRQKKQNPHVPDFKHKDTGECLWLNLDDPPWVRKQLQLYDSKIAGGCPRVFSTRSHEWNLEDPE